LVAGAPRRNLDWVRPHTDLSAVSDDEALLLADAQTSGGLLLGGEHPGAPVLGEFGPRWEFAVVIRETGTKSCIPYPGTGLRSVHGRTDGRSPRQLGAGCLHLAH